MSEPTVIALVMEALVSRGIWFTGARGQSIGQTQYDALASTSLPVDAELASLREENERLKAERDEALLNRRRWEVDNHHNALACPYCNPDRAIGELAPLQARLATAEAERDEAIAECRKRKGWEQDIAHWRERAEAAESSLAALRAKLETLRVHVNASGCGLAQSHGLRCGLVDQVARLLADPVADLPAPPTGAQG